jgi:uncharacterized protein YcbK (DUF882 family)
MARLPAFLTIMASLLICMGTQARAGKGGKMTDSEFMASISALMDETPPAPDVNDAMFEELEDNDLETWVFVSGSKAHPPAPVNLGGNGRLTLVRPAYREKITAVYRRRDGTYDQEEIKKIQRIMRSGGTGEETEPSILLLEILDAVEDKLGGKGLVLLSGYRTPHFNNKVPGSARYSMHMLGWAADIRIPGRTALQIKRYAEKLHAGGVGYYPDAAFVHLDSGRYRHWTVRSKP